MPGQGAKEIREFYYKSYIDLKHNATIAVNINLGFSVILVCCALNPFSPAELSFIVHTL